MAVLRSLLMRSPPLALPAAAAAESLTKTKAAVQLLKKVGAALEPEEEQSACGEGSEGWWGGGRHSVFSVVEHKL